MPKAANRDAGSAEILVMSVYGKRRLGSGALVETAFVVSPGDLLGREE